MNPFLFLSSNLWNWSKMLQGLLVVWRVSCQFHIFDSIILCTRFSKHSMVSLLIIYNIQKKKRRKLVIYKPNTLYTKSKKARAPSTSDLSCRKIADFRNRRPSKSQLVVARNGPKMLNLLFQTRYFLPPWDSPSNDLSQNAII